VACEVFWPWFAPVRQLGFHIRVNCAIVILFAFAIKFNTRVKPVYLGAKRGLQEPDAEAERLEGCFAHDVGAVIQSPRRNGTHADSVFVKERATDL